LPSLENVALSPEGSRIAFVKTVEGNASVVAVVSFPDRQVLGTIRAGEEKLAPSNGWTPIICSWRSRQQPCPSDSSACPRSG
jgi:hypothetical protein